MSTKLFTSEAVSCGHPDKICDQLSDALLDAYLAQDAHARVASEILVTTNFVCLGGERRTPVNIDVEETIRKTIETIGYAGNINPGFDAAAVHVLNHMNRQSDEIAQGVDAGDRASEGAGDQGLMFGFACTQTPDLMPAPIYYAHAVLRYLEAERRAGNKLLRPDAKSQVTLEYRNGQPVRAHTLLVSHQHTPDATHEQLLTLITAAWKAVLPEGWLDANTRILINPTGSFVLGGPAGDTGLTGRKIIVDTYGGYARHGGGAFSGKDPTKVDRSAAYVARYLAKNVVAAGLATSCEIQLAYAIGIPEPLAVYVDTFGTATDQAGKPSPEFDVKLSTILPKVMDLTPRGIRNHLGLSAPIYLATASGGHFGRKPDSAGKGTFSWERTDLLDAIKSAM